MCLMFIFTYETRQPRCRRKSSHHGNKAMHVKSLQSPFKELVVKGKLPSERALYLSLCVSNTLHICYILQQTHVHASSYDRAAGCLFI